MVHDPRRVERVCGWLRKASAVAESVAEAVCTVCAATEIGAPFGRPKPYAGAPAAFGVGSDPSSTARGELSEAAMG
jgi:hypothetical protein